MFSGLAELLPVLLLLLLTGAFAGVLAGLLGVGGGIVIVPILYHVFVFQGVDAALAMPLSVGTSLATIVMTSLVSARKHSARGGVDFALVQRWWPAVLMGVVLGSFIPTVVDGLAIKSAFGFLLIVVALHMLWSSVKLWHWSEQLPGVAGSSALGLLVGSLSALLGIGGGTLVVPILTLFGVLIHRAVATASVFGILISLPATGLYIVNGWGQSGLPVFSTGYVNWLAFFLIVPLTMALAPLGVKLAYALNVAQLKRVFAVFLCLVGVKMAFF